MPQMGRGNEIERKFVLAHPPADLPPGMPIRQGYLAIDGAVEVRVRQAGDDCVLTVKAGSGETRAEEEIPISTERFAALWPLTERRRISKVRHRMAAGDHVAEVDVYGPPLEGLVVGEVEFESAQASRSFVAPAWLGREVTGDTRYANASLASSGAAPAPG
jgi:adenylate cyclase